VPITGEENNIQKIKLLCGTYNSPNRIEKDSHSTKKIEQTSAENMISFFCIRGRLMSLFSKGVLKLS